MIDGDGWTIRYMALNIDNGDRWQLETHGVTDEVIGILMAGEAHIDFDPQWRSCGPPGTPRVCLKTRTVTYWFEVQRNRDGDA